jgi:hypothetical protein
VRFNLERAFFPGRIVLDRCPGRSAEVLRWQAFALRMPALPQDDSGKEGGQSLTRKPSAVTRPLPKTGKERGTRADDFLIFLEDIHRAEASSKLANDE